MGATQEYVMAIKMPAKPKMMLPPGVRLHPVQRKRTKAEIEQDEFPVAGGCGATKYVKRASKPRA
jgi:hypothetical protein